MAEQMMMKVKETEEVSKSEDKSVLADKKETEVEIVTEVEASFQDIILLEGQGISVTDITKLKNAGINTIKGFQMTIKKKLNEIEGIDDEKIAKIKEACTKLSFGNCFMTALEFSGQRKQLFKLNTGSKALNNLLGGGIESMSITEVFGEFGTGKTQLSHTLCVTAQMPGSNGYLGGKVIFIDTEHTFRPERLCPIANRFNLNPMVVQENVLYARAYNSEHQFELLNGVAAKFHQEAGVYKLLIIDSIMALFRVDFNGRREMADRQHKLGQMLSRLQKMSEEYNIAVFLTNQITSDLATFNRQYYHQQLQQQQHDDNVDVGNVVKPIGGNVLAHASTTRVSFSKVGKKRIAKLYDSPDLEEKEVEFCITAGGIDDVRD